MSTQTTGMKPVDHLSKLLETHKKQIIAALPKHIAPERMARMALTVFSRNPGLQECTPSTIFACIIQAAELGLELSGPLGQAYMVPRKNKHNNTKEATFQVGYRGLISLAFRSGKVKTFAAHVVHANDHFQYSLGTSPIIEHLPVLRDRGEIVAVYALVLQKDGENDCEVMSREDIESHRNKYCEKKAEQYDPWQTAWEEMAKKTVIRRLAKRVPMSVEMTKASVLDEYGEVGVQQELPQVGGVFPAKFIGSSSQQADAAQEKLNPKSSPQPAADREPGAESEGPYAEGF